jgi:hypothetical protein
MNLSDTPNGPACPSRASGRVHALRRWGFPCCVRSPCTDMLSPLPRWDHRRGCCRSPETRDGGLPHTFAGSAPTLPISRPARRSLTLRPVCSRSRRSDPFHRRLRQYRYLHCRSDCYRLERPLAGWELHPLKIDAFARRTKVLGWVFDKARGVASFCRSCASAEW